MHPFCQLTLDQHLLRNIDRLKFMAIHPFCEHDDLWWQGPHQQCAQFLFQAVPRASKCPIVRFENVDGNMHMPCFSTEGEAFMRVESAELLKHRLDPVLAAPIPDTTLRYLLPNSAVLRYLDERDYVS